MRHLLLALPVALTLAAGATVVSGAFAAADRSGIVPLPHWLARAETQTLDGVFGGAKPVQPRKVAVSSSSSASSSVKRAAARATQLFPAAG
jgi:hypothetical protein